MRLTTILWVSIAFGSALASARESPPRLAELKYLATPISIAAVSMDHPQLPIQVSSRQWVQMRNMETVLAGASGMEVSPTLALDVLVGGRYLQSMNSVIRGPSRVEYKDFQLFVAFELMMF